MRALIARPWLLTGALVVLLCLLSLARPLDHDESQYVAAAVLTVHGLLPYRDYAYLQTPLQPFLFAPIAWIAGAWTWPALRIVNALLGGVTIASVYRAARVGGASERMAIAGAALFASTDIFLFSVGVARNDALPAALFAAALIPILRAARDQGTREGALLAGLLLAAAAAAKVSYALPATAYGIVALIDRRHRPLWVASGSVLPVLFVLWMWRMAPNAFVFDTLTFPSAAPAEYYHAIGKAWKLSVGAKIVDVLKFLALGPALAALALIRRYRWRAGESRVLDWLLTAAFLAAILPAPTWRQYLLPVLPLLFVRLAIGWSAGPPGRRARSAMAVFVCAGLAPSIVAVAGSAGGLPMVEAMQQSRAIGAIMSQAGIMGPVATLSPQFLLSARSLPDARFAAGPFYFRSQRLLDTSEERAEHLVSSARIDADIAAAPPQAILIGGEGPWTSGDTKADAMLEQWAIAQGYKRRDVPGGRFRLYLKPR
jgi:4-amino-4-deoxy-L-arabinose transferase-like glycosyltransferase